ncbi:MAG: hypothetical protein HZC17_07060 [Candidatus Omnitrophica bacterium]|nr:hypothetical protein [Candidatus Omnitrophota bacterium]
MERKPDRSPVTMADRKIEEFLSREITRAFPKDGILGEEFGRTRKEAGSYWVIDPIDGTRAFTRGLPSWGILVARVENGKPVVGACDLPAIGTFMGAVRGGAAYERAGKVKKNFLKPRPVSNLSEAVLFHGGASFFFRSKYKKAFEGLLQQCYLERAYGDCYAYLWVLRGYADVMMDLGVKEWDLAPFAVFAETTGRVLVNFSGKSDFKGPDTIFGNPKIAKIIVKKF